jgi:hypothetical protein
MIAIVDPPVASSIVDQGAEVANCSGLSAEGGSFAGPDRF